MSNDEEVFVFHCKVGDHDVSDGTVPSICAYCSRSLCCEHQGNKDVIAGKYIACVDHVEEVALMIEARDEKERRHYKRLFEEEK